MGITAVAIFAMGMTAGCGAQAGGRPVRDGGAGRGGQADAANDADANDDGAGSESDVTALGRRDAAGGHQPADLTDLGALEAGAVLPGEGGGRVRNCRRLDVLFSVDNSSSMREEQSVMGTVIFPAFARKLRMIGPDLEDFRVGVTDACPAPPTLHTRGRGGDCAFFGGKPWIESQSPRLEPEFACVGAVDSSGTLCSGRNDDEQPASAAIAALSPGAVGVGGVNAGFLRSDAVLVVIAMTDEDEQPMPAQTAQEVHDRLVALKGDADQVVFLGIGGATACSGPYGNASEAVTLKAISGLFAARGRGVFWDLCAGSLEDGLGRAIETIKVACEEVCLKGTGTACPS